MTRTTLPGRWMGGGECAAETQPQESSVVWVPLPFVFLSALVSYLRRERIGSLVAVCVACARGGAAVGCDTAVGSRGVHRWGRDDQWGVHTVYRKTFAARTDGV